MLKVNGVVHKGIKTTNVLVKVDPLDTHASKEIRKLKITLIDFSWARPIAKNDVGTTTLNAGTQGKIAPEIILRNSAFKNRITEKPFSFPVDVFCSGITLLETFKKDFFPNLEAAFRIQDTGNQNIRVTETAAISSFAMMCDEFNYNSDERKNILYVDGGCKHNLDDRQTIHFKRYVDKASSVGLNLGSDKSLSLRFILNFWLKNLDPTLGWTNKIKEQAAEFCLKMIHYWPERRPTPEELFEDPIFKCKDPVTGKIIIEPEAEPEDSIITKIVSKSKTDPEYDINMEKMANTQHNFILSFKPHGQISDSKEEFVYSLDPKESKTTVIVKGIKAAKGKVKGQVDRKVVIDPAEFPIQLQNNTRLDILQRRLYESYLAIRNTGWSWVVVRSY